MAMRMAKDMMTATAMPAGVMPPDEPLELDGVASALSGLVGIGVGEVDVADVLVEETEELVVVLVGSDEAEVVVRTAGPGIVVTFSSPSSPLKKSKSMSDLSREWSDVSVVDF